WLIWLIISTAAMSRTGSTTNCVPNAPPQPKEPLVPGNALSPSAIRTEKPSPEPVTRPEQRGAAFRVMRDRPEGVHAHQVHRAAAQHPHAVERAAAEQHHGETQIVWRGRHQAGVALKVAGDLVRILRPRQRTCR